MSEETLVVFWYDRQNPEMFGHGVPIPADNARQWAAHADRYHPELIHKTLNRKQLEAELIKRMGKAKGLQKAATCFGSLDA